MVELLTRMGVVGEALEWAVALALFLFCLTAVYKLELRRRRR